MGQGWGRNVVGMWYGWGDWGGIGGRDEIGMGREGRQEGLNFPLPAPSLVILDSICFYNIM